MNVVFFYIITWLIATETFSAKLFKILRRHCEEETWNNFKGKIK